MGVDDWSFLQRVGRNSKRAREASVFGNTFARRGSAILKKAVRVAAKVVESTEWSTRRSLRRWSEIYRI
jgi:hypothetical protein